MTNCRQNKCHENDLKIFLLRKTRLSKLRPVINENIFTATIENNPGSLLLGDADPMEMKSSPEHKFHQGDIVIRNSIDATPR